MKLLSKLADYQEKYPVLILLIALFFTLFMLFYAVQIKTDSSFDTMFSDTSNTIILGDLVSNEFGSTDTLFVLVKVDEELDDEEATRDIREPFTLLAMDRLQQSLESETTVSSTVSIVDALMQVYGRLPDTLSESKEMIANLPFDTTGLMSEDFTAFNLIVDINVGKKPGSLIKIQDSINDKIENAPTPAGVSMTLTGIPTLINRIMILLIGDNVRTIGIALIGVFALLWFYFRSIPIALTAVLPVVLTLVWLTGTLTLMGIHITMLIASVGAMMVGMGIDYSIHMTHQFHENIKDANKNATKSTVVSVGGALLASAATTIAGFLAMLLGSTPSSQTQGQVLAIGISYAIVAAIVVLPAVLAIQRKLLYSNLDEVLFKIKKGTSTAHKGALLTFLSKLASFQTKRPKTVLLIVLVFTILLIPGFSFVRLDTDNENWIPDGDPVVEALDDVGFNFGGIDTQNFLIMLDSSFVTDTDKEQPVPDLRDPRVLVQLGMIDEALSELTFVDSVSSPSQDIKRLNNGRIPQNIETIKTLIDENPSLEEHFNDDYSITKVTITSNFIEREDYFEALSEFFSTPLPEEVLVVPQGGAADDIELEEELGRDTGMTTLFGFLFVIIIASLIYRSLLVGMLAFIPIIFSIMWTIAIMGYIDLPFTILTSGMLAILMGMGVDFSIHIIHKTRESLANGMTIGESISHALTSTGEAISVASLTTIVGFMALSFATLLGTQRLGYTLAIGIFATFLSCMLIVPATLALEHAIRNKPGGTPK